MPALRAVRRITAAKRVALHNALKTLSLCDADRVDVIALGKNRHADFVTGFQVHRIISEFLDPLYRRDAALLDMTQQRLREPMFLLLVKTQLHRVVAVALDGLALDHMVRPGLHY